MTNAIVKKSNRGWLLGGIFLLGSFLGYKAFQLISWYNALGINFKGKISGYRDGNILLKCEAVLDNPKNFELTITKPTIRIYSGTTLLANSDPSAAKVKIVKNGITTIPYELKVPLLSGELAKILLSIGKNIPSIISSISSGTAINLGIKLDVLAYMQLGPGIERTWKQQMSI